MLEAVKQRVVPAICSLLTPTVWERITGINPTAAYYHIVSDVDVPHVKHLYQFRNVGQFKQDVEAFCRLFRPISFFDLLASFNSSHALQPGSFLITFDDGFRELYDVVAPILRAKGVPATFFLTSACIDNKFLPHHNKISLLIEHLDRARTEAAKAEIRRVLSACSNKEAEIKPALLRLDFRKGRTVETIAEILQVDFAAYLSTAKPYLTSEQVSKLIAMGFAIGGHSVDHPLYAALSFDEQLHQTRASLEFVRERFSLNYGAFAFPHGHNTVSQQFLREAFSQCSMDVCFGTGGIMKGVMPNHLHRFSMENSSAPAGNIVAHFYGRNLYKKMAARCGKKAGPQKA